MNLQFQYPQALWLLLLIPFLILLLLLNRLWKNKAVKRIGEPRLVKELYKNHSSLKATLKAVLAIIAFTLGVIAVANPRKPEEGYAENRKGIDVLIALDVSNSMLATDVAPNRLQQAKNFVLELIDKFPNDRIGLVLFAGNAYLQMPLTFDHDAAQLFVATATPGSIPAQGTAIGEALQKCDLALANQNDRFKTIILITDGETHDEEAAKVAENLAEKGVMINAVGLGSPQGATIIDTVTNTAKRDAAGNVVVSKLNEALLQQLATTANGRYIQFKDVASTVSGLQEQLTEVERKALVDVSQLNYTTFYVWFVVPMLLLLIVELFLPDRKKVVA